jgi:hypothetical protein
MEEENKNISEQPLESTDVPVEGTVFKEKESKVGPMIGSIIVIIIIIVGGLYFWSNYVEDIKQDAVSSEEEVVNEIENLENELDDLNLDSIEEELDAIDEEFDSI